MKRVIETAKEVLISIKKNPLDIKLLLLFSILITVVIIFIHLDWNEDLDESIVPYTGWNPGSDYRHILFFIVFSSFTIKNHQKSILFIRGMSAVFIGFSLYDGVIDWTTISPEDFTNTNPYLRYDPLRPIFTIALPLFWMLIITGSQLNDYFNNKKNQNNTIIIHQ
jgi:hypothetical protein